MSAAVPWENSGSEIKWGQDNPIENAPVLTAEDQHTIKQRIAAMDKLLQEQGKAKYKIELMFARKRSMHKPCPGLITFWESGTKLHGGGDTKIYLCPGRRLGKNDCEAFIPFSSNGYGYLLCPACKTVWTGDDVIGELLYNLPLKTWAEVLLKHFVKLNHNADFYVKHSKQDIRAASTVEQQRQHKGEKLALARNDRPKYIYPLKNVIKDTAAGSDLLKRIYAFLTA